MTEPLQANKSLGKAGCVTFSSAEIAANYLIALPEGYSGKLKRGEGNRWIVSYRFSRLIVLASRLNDDQFIPSVSVQEFNDISQLRAARLCCYGNPPCGSELQDGETICQSCKNLCTS